VKNENRLFQRPKAASAAIQNKVIDVKNVSDRDFGIGEVVRSPSIKKVLISGAFLQAAVK
jgi:hypothetical protein